MNRYLQNENHGIGNERHPITLYQLNKSKGKNLSYNKQDEFKLILLKEGTMNVSINLEAYKATAPNILSFKRFDALQANIMGFFEDGVFALPMFILKDNKIFESIKRCYEDVEENICKIGQSEDEYDANAAYFKVKIAMLQMMSIFFENGELTNIGDLEEKKETHINFLKKSH